MRRRAGTRLLTLVALAVVALAALPVSGQGRTSTRIEDDIEEAQKLFDDKEWDKAIEKYQSIIRRAPQGSPVAYWKLATILLAVKKNPRGALEICERGTTAFPDNGDILKQKGIAQLTLKQHGAAIRSLQAALAAGTPPTMTYDANAFLCQLLAKKDCGKAIPACSGFLKDRPADLARNDLAVRLRRGIAFNLCGKHRRALKDFEAVVRVAPKTAIAQVGKFEALYKLGDCGRAANLGQELNRKGYGNKHPVIFFGLATCMIEFRRSHEAVTYARSYVSHRSADLAGHVLLGDAYRAKGDPANAIASYRTVLKRDPTHQEALTKMGDALLTTKRYTEARQIAQRVLQRAPESVDAAILYGRASLRLKQPQKAIDQLEKLKGKQRTPYVHYVLAWAYHDAKDLETSVRRFDEALKGGWRPAKAASVRVRNRLASRYLSKSKFKEAEATLREAQEIDRANITTAQNLGLVRILKGDAKGAITALSFCLRRKPTDIVVNRLVGRAYLMRRDTARALKYYAVAERSAQKVRGRVLAEVYAETGGVHLQQGKLDEAVQRLEAAEGETRDPKVLPVIKRNLAVAYLKRGMQLVRNKEAGKGVADLLRAVEREDFVPKEQRTQLRCALAFSYLGAGKAADAAKQFSAVAKAGGCKLRAPYDRLGIDFFHAYALYRDGGAGNVRAALKTFKKLSRKARGRLSKTMKQLQRSGHEQLALALYNRNDYKGAGAELRAAKTMGPLGPAYSHNMAVLELAQGKGGRAAKVLEGLSGRPPESLMNLGIYFDKQGDPKKALELYRKAYERGVRLPRLKAWIDVKERLFGSAAGKGQG